MAWSPGGRPCRSSFSDTPGPAALMVTVPTSLSAASLTLTVMLLPLAWATTASDAQRMQRVKEKRIFRMPGSLAPLGKASRRVVDKCIECGNQLAAILKRGDLARLLV